jgi:superfamily II DNA/RNA helicase
VHLLEDVPKVIKKFKAKPNLAIQYDVLVTTPNRLVFLLNCKPTVATLSAVQWLIIDESDKLFEAFKDGGFRDQVLTLQRSALALSID